jgi:mannose-6-phosphate isomerase class I
MIYRCIPRRVSRIWGSLPPDTPGGEPTGEVWWFFEETILKNSRGEETRADRFFTKNSFPLIIKTLHAACNLSVQVHPGRDCMKPVKDESWVVLEGCGTVMHGAADGTTPEQFRLAVENGSVESLLQHIQGEPGVFVHLPAGTVHALGGGLTVLEVQLNCTVTYRLWDYSRTDLKGNRRELHITKGLEAVNWQTMGRAVRVTGDYLDAGSYFMRRAEPGTIELKPLEVAFLLKENLCYFADREGGTVSSSGGLWVVGMLK